MKIILVIEDEQPLRESICEILKFEKFAVLQAENGRQGVEQAIQHLPDLILCDIMMPALNGMEVLETLRSKESTKMIPFIFLTALSDRVNVRSGMELGADDYIGKPFTKDELLRAISIRLKKAVEIKKKLAHAAELETVNKSLNAFAQTVSNSLKTPLRAMDSYTRILMDDYVEILDKDGIRYLETIRASSSKMRLLIDGLLLFANQQKREINRSSVNMKSLVQHVAADFNSRKNEKPVEIIVADIPHAYCDETMIKQVFINLISNAIKYSEKKSKPVIEVGHLIINNEGVYYVKDNGVGFDMKFYPKLFSVFHRLHSEKEFIGIGIGLFIVKEIIEKHGGHVWAEGIVDEGTTFYFTL